MLSRLAVSLCGVLFLCGGVMAVTPAAAPGSSSPESAGQASAVVERLHGRLLEAMQSGDTAAGRFERLHAELGEIFDFHRIARTVLGRSDVDDATRARMASTLARLTAASYARNFDAHDGERFETLESVAARGERRLVRTRLSRAGVTLASLDYLLEFTPAGPRVINVIANGVSDLSLKRAEYSSVIRDSGVEALLERIDRQIRELLHESATSG